VNNKLKTCGYGLAMDVAVAGGMENDGCDSKDRSVYDYIGQQKVRMCLAAEVRNG
jgi:hypothetical protein